MLKPRLSIGVFSICPLPSQHRRHKFSHQIKISRFSQTAPLPKVAISLIEFYNRFERYGLLQPILISGVGNRAKNKQEKQIGSTLPERPSGNTLALRSPFLCQGRPDIDHWPFNPVIKQDWDRNQHRG